MPEMSKAFARSLCRPAPSHLDKAPRYSVIVDRISHDIPFYRAFLKHAAINGTVIINNPFWWSADDKFFNYTLAEQLGVAVPPTVILPHKQLPEEPPNARCATWSIRSIGTQCLPMWASTDF